MRKMRTAALIAAIFFLSAGSILPAKAYDPTGTTATIAAGAFVVVTALCTDKKNDTYLCILGDTSGGRNGARYVCSTWVLEALGNFLFRTQGACAQVAAQAKANPTKAAKASENIPFRRATMNVATALHSDMKFKETKAELAAKAAAEKRQISLQSVAMAH